MCIMYCKVYDKGGGGGGGGGSGGGTTTKHTLN